MTPSQLLALALSSLIGVSLGLLGGGGSILAVPVLVYVAGLDPHAAVGSSLAIVGATALVGGLVHARHGRADLRAAAMFAGAGMLGAPLGSLAAPLVSGRTLLLLFASLMHVVSALMLRGRPSARAAGGRRPAAVLAAGFGVGALTGFLGVGGGFLIVPALVLLGGLPMRLAVGTSLLVIAINSAAGFLGHLGEGGAGAVLTGAFTLASVLGAFAGQRLAGRLSPDSLRTAFGLLVLLLGGFLLVKSVPALLLGR